MPKGTITITIVTGNAAFEDNDEEIRSILMTAANKAVDMERDRITESRSLQDSNGNTVGNVTYHHERD